MKSPRSVYRWRPELRSEQQQRRGEEVRADGGANNGAPDRRARGKQARDRTPLFAHTGWIPAVDRPDPVALLQEQDATREPDLVPVRHGQRMMQAASDIFLGWTKGLQANRYYYWRQLRDMKGSVEVEALGPVGLNFYAGICGWTLARAHARSGDPVAMAEYLGEGDQFDRAVTDFVERYADQNERDCQAFINGDPLRTAARPRRPLRSSQPAWTHPR